MHRAAIIKIRVTQRKEEASTQRQQRKYSLVQGDDGYGIWCARGSSTFPLTRNTSLQVQQRTVQTEASLHQQYPWALPLAQYLMPLAISMSS